MKGMSDLNAWLGIISVCCWSLNCGGSTTTEVGSGSQAAGGAGVGSSGASGDSSGASGSASTGGAAGAGVAGSIGAAGTGGAGGTTVPIFDASAPVDGGTVLNDASDCNCLPVTLHWGNNGGNVRYTDD